MNVLSQQFGNAQVVKATGVSNQTIQAWLRRGLVVGHRQIEGGGSPGLHRRFSYFNVIELATAKALIDLGLRTSDALRAAQSFAHGGSGERLPGVPFDSRTVGCRTLLCVAGERSFAYKMTEAINPLYAEARHRLGSGNFVIINMSELFERVTMGLGFDHRDVLGHAYDKAAA